MAEPQIRFDDGAAYERYMGVWSRLAGDVFIDWLAPPTGARWIDIGCGNGAFTELIVERCAPAEVLGIDPSEGQIAFARTRLVSRVAEFRVGDAASLPFAAGRFDAAVMALVIFFVPEPAKGVAEMARVVRPGGLIATYAWDLAGGGFPLEALQSEMHAMGVNFARPPSADASRMDVLHDLWSAAGLDSIETREITVQRSFTNFDEYWAISQTAPSTKMTFATMAPGDVERLKERTRARLPADAAGRITYAARANAIKGCVPT